MLAEPFPADWERILKRNVAVYERLSDSERLELRCLTKLFLDSKEFEGCGGLEITDEISVTVAAEACVLLLNRGIRDPYPNVRSILIYPHAYVAPEKKRLGNTEVIAEGAGARLGESWQDGEVVLAWDHAKNGSRDFDDGQNVVLHEFSHKLDQASGSANGAPLLKDRYSYKTWGLVLGREFALLRDEVAHHKKDVIDAYGATNPAEFFAVATETFFEKPIQLRSEHPELFEELRKYYNIDPNEWSER